MSNLKRLLDNNHINADYLLHSKIRSQDDAKAYIDNCKSGFYMHITNNCVYDRLYDDTVISNPDKIIIEKQKIAINREINSLADLIALIDDYPLNENIEYNIDIQKLNKLKAPLLKLNAMVGLNDLKNSICDQIIYYIQDMYKIKSLTSSTDYMHTVLYGPPGTGKTEIAKIIGEIFNKMGILLTGKFTKVTRSDLVAGYLGQTAIKTATVIKDALGGVLFIDEAYSLGNADKRDSFSKECLDTLCESLSNYKDNLMVIIAGYETELNDCFFSYNQGLKSRFTWNYKINAYSSDELRNIFLKKIADNGWKIGYTITAGFFEKNMGLFKSFGRDIENLFSKIKIAHSRRVFCLDAERKTIITEVDVLNGFELFKKNLNEEKDDKIDNLMYS